MLKKVSAAVVLIVLLTVAIVQAMDNKDEPVSTNAGINVGDKAPDFEVKTLKGETVKLSDYKGKKVMLNFWATWCGPCKAEMPDMQKFYEQGHEDVVILAVNIDPQLDVQKFVDDMSITFSILLDEEDKINTDYKVISIPTTYFIDKKGIIRDKFIGAMPLNAMEQYTKKL